MAKLDARALGLSLGVLWGLSVVFMGLAAMACSWAARFVHLLSSLYIGYDATITGSLIGGVWGFVDAAIAGVLIAWLYNKFAK